jgi:hypothetical protein
MEVAERYRRYAANCLKIAKQIHDETIKSSLLDMAQVWMTGHGASVQGRLPLFADRASTSNKETGCRLHSNPPPRSVRTFISVITARMIVAGLILTVTTTRNVFRMSRTTFRVVARR